jgi:Ca-activated chloride channel family protein
MSVVCGVRRLEHSDRHPNQARSAVNIPHGEKGGRRFAYLDFSQKAKAHLGDNRLRHLAEFANGQYLDLTVLSDGQALAELTTIRPRLASLSGDGVDDLVSASIHPEGGRLVLAGRVTEPKAAVTVDTVDGAGKHSQRRISVPVNDDASGEFAAKRWAGLRIASLQRDGNRNRAEILRLGEVFGVISDETSLLALERMEDFLRYDVMPPWREMRAEFMAWRRPNALDPQADKGQVEDLVRRFNELASWWGTDFPKGEKPKPKPEREGDLAVQTAAR